VLNTVSQNHLEDLMGSTTPRWAAIVALAVAVGCSSSNPTGPGQTGGALPGNTGTAPTPKANDSAEKQSMKGRVVDARTGEGIAKATVVAVQAQESETVASDSPSVANAGATDSATASGGATADVAPARPASRPRSSGKKREPVKVTADDKGHFEIKDLVPGLYAVTGYSKNHVSVTFVGPRPSKDDVTLALPPQGEESGGYEISGKVALISRKPAAGVMVGAALPPGLYAGAPAVTDADGGFTLGDLPSGKLLFASWTTGDVGEVRTWGVQRDVKVAEGKEKKSGSPQITLRAVARSIVLSGKVDSANKAIKPRQVQVMLSTEDGAEVALLTRTPDKDGHFRFSVPAPEEKTTYHLIASGVDSAGNATYAHLHRLAGQSFQYDLTLPDLPATPSVVTDTTPEWSWNAAPEVSVYRVRLETTGDDGKTLWEGWTSGTSITLPQVGSLALKHGESYKFTVSAIKTQGAFELIEVASTPWAAAASLAPREFVAGEALKDDAPRNRPASLREETANESRPAPLAPPAVTRREGASGAAPYVPGPAAGGAVSPAPGGAAPRPPTVPSPGATKPGK
jgi:hypothetical protein